MNAEAQREAMDRFIRSTAWSFVLKGVATERWDRDVTVRIAERGTFQGIPVKGWTNTETGTIFMREEIFDGIDLDAPGVWQTLQIVTHRLVNGMPINRETLFQELGYRNLLLDAQKDLCWRVAQTVAANYGVFGHEYCHAAYSEHAARDAWHMGLEDLRAESLWMAQDPIRARQGLRACASFWVLHDTSPIAGDAAMEMDLSKVTSYASLLHLYLLIGGRGRIGVLDDRSVLVTGVQRLAVDVLGWEVVSDADDIIDRFLETSEDLDDAEGAAQRAALAEEFAHLLPQAAGQPNDGIGCHCDPKQTSESTGQGEGEGQGEGQGEGGDTAEGQGQSQGEASGPSIGVTDDSSGVGISGRPQETPDFLTGSYGEMIRPGVEEVTDKIDESDAYRLTQEQVQALAEVLTDGLKEVSDSDGEAGWAISDTAGAVITSRFHSPAKVSADVFSRQARTTRNRRIRART